ncbi:unnamed protein product [Euphydryas editha]|uniref:Fucosyltransferase n=1 Tax=Euphydryas editha TaxID=104508 RepID=A0AAU9TMH4_EUPED|nr:unnamed protein product [Euphydryas editha]
MCKTIKTIIITAYCVIFLHSLKYLIFDTKEKIIELNYLVRTSANFRKILKDIKKNRKNTTILTLDYERPRRFSSDLKFILKWNNAYIHRRSVITNGQKSFLYQNCTYYNCYLTNDKSLLVDLRCFDAIVFDVDCDWDEHPPLRTPYQIYIFSASESASNYPVCNSNYDNYYNISWTYKLDSDITKPLITILDKNENIIGPKANMTWIYPMLPTSETVKKKIMYKKKAAAWFISNCHSENSKARQILAEKLSKLLTKVNLTLDIYGWCGNMVCPRDRIEECLSLLRKEYFFYFAFEYSLSEDYVTSEILYPLLHYAVPIVYGGANYSRFLPPGSYIDARKLSPNEVVSLMVEAIKNPDIYKDYFKWHNHYTYKETPQDDICNLCQILNEPTHNRSVVSNFRKWWNPNYEEHC